MKPVINIVGILLILFGIVIFAYQGFTYTQQEKIAQIGSLQVTADTEKTIYFPPLLGGLALAVGIVLVVVGRKSK
jgi:uncharacterized membrane protein